jgi:hypothetical protein
VSVMYVVSSCRRWELGPCVGLPDWWLRSVVRAGDISSNAETFQRAMRSAHEAFEAVFVTLGNHDLWVSSALKERSVVKHLETQTGHYISRACALSFVARICEDGCRRLTLRGLQMTPDQIRLKL